MFLPADRGFALLDRAGLAVNVLFFLLNPLFNTFDFFAAVGELSVQITSKANCLVFGRDLCVSSDLFGLLQDLISLALSHSRTRVGAALQEKQGTCN